MSLPLTTSNFLKKYWSGTEYFQKQISFQNRFSYYRFRHALMTWGDKFSSKEVDDAFDAMDIDDNGRIDTQGLITLLTASKEDEEGGEAA